MRLVIVGWGAMAQYTVELLAGTLRTSPVELVAVGVRDESAERPDLPDGVRLITEPNELAGLSPDLVVEAAGRESVEPWGTAALACGADFVVSSVSALADIELLTSLSDLAVANGAHLQIQPGALAGVEALRSARLMGVDTVEHRIVKPPAAWVGTPAEGLCDLGRLDGPTEFFRSDAATAATTFPKNANVAMTVALAGIGPTRSMVTLIADPQATANRHEITAQGAFGQMQVAIENSPLPTNPKTSAMAALSLVRLIQNRVGPVAI